MTSEQRRKPDVAPDGLETLRLFLNTRDLEAGLEEFDEAGSLARWLREHELLGQDETVGHDDVRRARELREAIRSLLSERSEPMRASRAALSFNAAAQSTAPLQVEISPDATVTLVATRSGAPRALGRIVAAVAGHAGTPAWERLKICDNRACQWAFYDHARNKTGRWCDMATCGNKAKARSYRQRRSDTVTAGVAFDPGGRPGSPQTG
ncbi:CGNR zinc finger domain-containing protein [Nonomuraea aurantiaca]|uniref:CGNR zinc finger domain-containing protein n=1 Tax=Nonomuraea aurantiaca TaxID=2878562 RepID=UPI001CDA1B39|nr:CGNR zinc finger domain-containing protein [Nonomuraea aurantiaca]MCA2229365.1 CGNR zinc finger domain-containing protein [Nonomuraea aurantiaca]